MKILLDLDGVCVDFVSAALRIFGHEFEDTDWPLGEYDIAKAIGKDHGEFWSAIHKQGVDFWRNLKTFVWFAELYEELHKFGHVYFVTTPTDSPYSASGKMLWLQDRYGSGFRDFVITHNKQLLSRSGCVLIDDYDLNVENFKKHGHGKAILFPQKWNQNHELINVNRVDYVIEQLLKIQSDEAR